MTRLIGSAIVGLLFAVSGALIYGLISFISTLIPAWAFGALFLGGFAATYVFDLLTSRIKPPDDQ